MHVGSPPIRVLFVVPSLERGGAERVVVNLANGLVALADDVTVVVTGSESGSPGLSGELAEGVHLSVLNSRRVRSALPRLVQAIRRLRPDAVLSTHTHVNLMLCAIRWMLPSGTRLILREPIHAPLELEGRSMRAIRIAQRLLYGRSDAIVASSDALAVDLAELTPAPIVRVENPVDLGEIRSRATAHPDIRRTQSLSGRYLLSVARLTPQKGLTDLIRIFDVASEKDDRLEIIGEGPERAELEALVHRLGLAGRVSLPGRLADHWGRLAQAEALVLASYAEGMPNVVLEALVLGTPVIATTDLRVLEPLADEVGEPALRLVPRDQLASALRAIPTRQGPFPGQSTLPERFELDAVVIRLREVLTGAPKGR